MKMILISIISFYQKFLSPDQGIFSSGRKYCALYPSCSQYAKEAVERYGVFYGLKKGFFRILRCHPWQTKIYDPLESLPYAFSVQHLEA